MFNFNVMVNIDKFKKWITDRGAELLPTTNEYEALRFKAKEIGVIYTSGKVSNSYTANAIECFHKNKKWEGKPISTGRSKNYLKEKKQLIKRDGTKCFYCNEEMYHDITLEHLIPLTGGGKNTLGNMVLCHEECNQIAGTKTVKEKIEIVLQNRLKR